MINSVHKDFYLKWSPQKVKGICIFLQDFNSKPSRYSGLAEFLCVHEILGIALDIFMPEVSEDRENVLAGNLSQIYLIIRNVYNEVSSKYKGIPVFLCGEGFGAIVALRYSQLYTGQIQGLVILAPFFELPLGFSEKLNVVKNFFINSRALIELPIKMSMITKDQWYMDVLTESESSRHYYSAGFLFHYWLNIKALIYSRKKIKNSILFLLAGDDLLTENKKAHQFFDSIDVIDKQINYYSEFHALSVPVGRDQIYNGIADWLIARSSY